MQMPEIRNDAGARRICQPGQNTICQSIGNRMQIVSRTIEKCSDNRGKTRPVFVSWVHYRYPGNSQVRRYEYASLCYQWQGSRRRTPSQTRWSEKYYHWSMSRADTKKRTHLTCARYNHLKEEAGTGIEPVTRGFSVHCSTNWAIWA